MRTYKTRSGQVLTEEDIEQLGQAAERGQFPGTPGELIVSPQGRPRLSDEDLVTVAFKVPRSRRDALDRKARARGETRSEFMREALERALA